MPLIPLILGGSTVLVALGISGGTYSGARQIGEGTADGLRYGIPIAVAGGIAYLLLRKA